MKLTRASAIALAGAAGLCLAPTAFGQVSDPFLVVRATNASGTGTLSIPLSDVTMNPNGSFTFSLSAPTDIMAGPNVIATVTQLNSTILPLAGATPDTISLSFAFVAGDSATTFTVDSATYTFAPLLNESGRCTAGVSVTDSNGDGVTFNGQGAAGAAFVADYNGTTSFAGLLAGPLSAGPGQTATRNASNPNVGFTPIAGALSDMSSHWNFTLSAQDQVGVTSGWFVVPTPGAAGVLGLGLLTASRRRR